jgi:hypothetical protein
MTGKRQNSYFRKLVVVYDGSPQSEKAVDLTFSLGHTHIPFIRRIGGRRWEPKSWELDKKTSFAATWRPWKTPCAKRLRLRDVCR